MLAFSPHLNSTTKPSATKDMTQRDTARSAAVTLSLCGVSVIPLVLILALVSGVATFSFFSMAERVIDMTHILQSTLDGWRDLNSSGATFMKQTAVNAMHVKHILATDESTNPKKHTVSNASVPTAKKFSQKYDAAELYRRGLMGVINRTQVYRVYKRMDGIHRSRNNLAHIRNKNITGHLAGMIYNATLDLQQLPTKQGCTRMPPLLTLFTVFSPQAEHQDFHINMLHNWAAFHPNISTVLFMGVDDAIAVRARELNWTILPTIHQRGSLTLPLKRMFSQVQDLFPDSTFYGYMKGELVFGTGLVATVGEVVKTLDNLESCLVVGAKYPFKPREGQELFDPAYISTIVREKDSFQQQSDMENTFVLAHQVFPWQHLPDVVIAQSAYQNYLIALALRYDFAVIDATQTLNAVEQVAVDPELVTTEPEDFDPNLLAALDYAEGYVTSAQYETTGDETSNVYLWRRHPGGQAPTLLSTRNGNDSH